MTVDEFRTEDLIDAWHEGYFSTTKAASPYSDAELTAEWEKGRAERVKSRKVRVTMIERPEGYYHAPLNDF